MPRLSIEELKALIQTAHSGDKAAQKELEEYKKNTANVENIENDFSQIVQLLLQTAENNDGEAQYNVGLMYFRGLIIKKDFKKAEEYFNKAAQHNHPESMYFAQLAKSCAKLEQSFQRMLNNAEIRKLEIARSNGVANYEKIKPSEDLGARASKEAAESYYNAAKMLQKKRAEIPGYEKVGQDVMYKDFVDAAKLGHPAAMNELGILNMNADAPNEQAGFDYFVQAAEKGNAHAMYNLGLMYRSGIGVPVDEGRAAQYFEAVRNSGYQISLPLDFNTYKNQFNDYLSQLGQLQQTFMQKFKSNDHEVNIAMRHLLNDLDQAKKPFFSNPSKASYIEFNGKCKIALNKASAKLEQHRGIWYQVPSLIRALLGLAALFSVVPAIIASAYAPHGYINTFFAPPKTESAKSLDAVNQTKLDLDQQMGRNWEFSS